MIYSLFAAANKPENCGKTSGVDPNDCLTTFPQVAADNAQIQHILAVVFGALAAVAVIVIFIAALNFAFAGADADRLKRARDTILYALIGLVVALTAEAIVLFVLGKI